MEQIAPLTKDGEAVMKCIGKSQECTNCTLHDNGNCSEVWGVESEDKHVDPRRYLRQVLENLLG